MSYTVIGGKLIKVQRNRWRGGNNIGEIINTSVAEKKKAELKGKRDGNCNVTVCQKPGATWWNTSTRAYYCPHCASEINRWSRHDEGYEICFPSESMAIAAKAMFTDGRTEGAW
jgi:hypothetical protein